MAQGTRKLAVGGWHLGAFGPSIGGDSERLVNHHVNDLLHFVLGFPFQGSSSL